MLSTCSTKLKFNNCDLKSEPDVICCWKIDNKFNAEEKDSIIGGTNNNRKKFLIIIIHWWRQHMYFINQAHDIGIYTSHVHIWASRFHSFEVAYIQSFPFVHI